MALISCVIIYQPSVALKFLLFSLLSCPWLDLVSDCVSFDFEVAINCLTFYATCILNEVALAIQFEAHSKAVT